MRSLFQSGIEPRKREGRVREHPSTDINGRKSTAQGMALLGAITAGIGLSTRRGNPTSRALLTLGGAIGVGLGVSKLYKEDPSVAVLGMASAGAAASLAYILTNKTSALGLRSLRDFISKHGPKATVDSAVRAVEDVRSKFPLVGSLLSKEGLALGAGIVTFPVAHSLMVKHFALEKRRTTDHGDTAFMAAWQDNKAGSTGMRTNNNPLFAYNQNTAADVSFSGNINSYYNSTDLFESL